MFAASAGPVLLNLAPAGPRMQVAITILQAAIVPIYLILLHGQVPPLLYKFF
jgi:hypothetical protein